MSRRRAKASPRGKEEDVRTMAGLVTAGIISLVVVISVILAPIPQVGPEEGNQAPDFVADSYNGASWSCLLYTSPSPRDQRGSRMPSSA